MLRRILSSAIFLFAVSFACAQPKLEIVGGDTHDWGKVKSKQSPVSAKIKIKNSGNSVLDISSVKPSCGCTTAPLDKNKLEPGEIATIDLKLNLPAHAGKFTKTVTITSNDPKNGQKVLKLEGELVKPFSVTPSQYLVFSDLEVGKESKSQVNIKNESDKAITLSDFNVTPDNVKINLKGKKVLKPGEQVTLVATVTPKKSGYMNCTVKMKTSDPDDTEIAVTGYGNVKESALFNNK